MAGSYKRRKQGYATLSYWFGVTMLKTTAPQLFIVHCSLFIVLLCVVLEVDVFGLVFDVNQFLDFPFIQLFVLLVEFLETDGF